MNSEVSDVSVVIPCYNDAEYLGAAIESAVGQTLSPKEVIVVDDGSSEDVGSVLEEYADRNRVEIIKHEENKGLPAARNTGIRNADGDYIAFLDADDEWVPEKLRKQRERFSEENSLGLVYSDHYRVTPEDEVMAVRRARDPPNGDFLERAFVNGIGGILPSTVIVRKRCFEEVGYFDERLHQAQELDMFMRIGAEFDIARVPETLVRRRVRVDSLGSDKSRKIRYRREIITPKFVEEYPRLEDLVDRREAYLSYLEASSLAKNGDVYEARRLLLASMRRYPWNWKVYARFITTLLGNRGAKAVSGPLQELKFKIVNVKQKVKNYR
jgi:glycosyltransferase involved in cell wall biosynthesis